MNMMKVGVVLTKYREANWCPAPTWISALTKATRPGITPLVLCSAISSKVGSMKWQGPHVVDIKKATTTRCDSNIDWNEAKFVETCIGETTEDSPGEGESGRRRGEDTAARSAADRNNDVAAWEVFGLGDRAKSAICPEYIRSMVGRSARPKSVERKSDGRSVIHEE